MVLEAPKLDVPKELNVAQDVSFKNSSSDKTKEEMETVKGKEEIESAKNATEDFKNAIQQQDWTYALSILLRPKVNIGIFTGASMKGFGLMPYFRMKDVNAYFKNKKVLKELNAIDKSIIISGLLGEIEKKIQSTESVSKLPIQTSSALNLNGKGFQAYVDKEIVYNDKVNHVIGSVDFGEGNVKGVNANPFLPTAKIEFSTSLVGLKNLKKVLLKMQGDN